MKLTIIPSDNAVVVDSKFYIGIDLSSCNIPANIHALQWQDTTGWLEDKSPLVQNQDITELPSWANACVTKWDEAKATEEALAAVEAAAAEKAAEETTTQVTKEEV